MGSVHEKSRWGGTRNGSGAMHGKITLHAPDLNRLDFEVWDHLKSLVYVTPVQDVGSLRDRNVEGCETIRKSPGIHQPLYRCNLTILRMAIYYSIFHVKKIALLLWQNFKMIFPVVYKCLIGCGATLSFVNNYPIGGRLQNEGRRCHLSSLARLRPAPRK